MHGARLGVKELSVVLLISTLLVAASLSAIRAGGIYRLAVKPGARASYIVIEALNVKVGGIQLNAGDRIDYVVTGKTTLDMRYYNGSVAFTIEIPLCDVKINGRTVMKNDTPQKLGLYMPYGPVGREYWEAQKMLLEDLRRGYEQSGKMLRYEIKYEEDVVSLSATLSGIGNEVEEHMVINVETGLLLKFEQTVRSPEGDIIRVFKGMLYETPETQEEQNAGGYGGWPPLLIWLIAGGLVVAGLVVVAVFMRGSRFSGLRAP